MDPISTATTAELMAEVARTGQITTGAALVLCIVVVITLWKTIGFLATQHRQDRDQWAERDERSKNQIVKLQADHMDQIIDINKNHDARVAETQRDFIAALSGLQTELTRLKIDTNKNK